MDVDYLAISYLLIFEPRRNAASFELRPSSVMDFFFVLPVHHVCSHAIWIRLPYNPND
jgi:hypothetical protein